MASPDRSRRIRRVVLHLCRACIFAAVLILIHLQASRRVERQAVEGVAAVPLSRLLEFFPTVKSTSEIGVDGRRVVLDGTGQPLGSYLQTSPESDHLIGFSGPTNVLVTFDSEERVVGLSILSSGDTKEHVSQVINDWQFLKSFDGLTQQEAVLKTDTDAVTGATLTSLAIYESILHRLGGSGQSLRFPNLPTLGEIQTLFPLALSVEQDTVTRSRWKVLGEDRELGYVLRTSPVVGNLIGYQGPTDTLIGLTLDGKVQGIKLRKSYDNEPYVGYVRADSFFLNLFNELIFAEVAKLDLQVAEVEGVSGATMTSMAVAQGVVLAAKDYEKVQQQRQRKLKIRWSLRDLGTALMILVGCAIGFSSLRSIRWLRVNFQVILIGYLGLINGDMISQAMLAGWAQHGVPWQNAGGLVMLTCAALLVPLTTRRNVYCTHLCPHGAAQQLLKNRLGWRLKIPHRVLQLLKILPGVLLAWCVLVVVWPLPFSLISIEPFDAWVFYVAGGATIAVAVVGLVASMFVPMAYCRFGCPTGALLGFLRFNAGSDQWTTRDWVAVGLLIMAVCLV